MNREDFKKRIDRELGGLEFTAQAEQRVLAAVGKPRGRISAFLDREIRIPVRPFAAALLIAATVTAYAVAGVVRVSAEDVQKSRIEIIDNNDGRYGDDIYKN